MSCSTFISDLLRFTQEIGGDFPDGRLPSLDTRIWVKNMIILFEFFEKTMSTNMVVHAKSALSEDRIPDGKAIREPSQKL